MHYTIGPTHVGDKIVIKYIIVGNGFIGKFLHARLGSEVSTIFPYHICEISVMSKLLKNYPDAVVINCGGATGKPNVDWCEQNKAYTFDANVRLPMIISEACQAENRFWIHIGSGCIYDGYEKKWEENDPPNMRGSFYAQTKIWAEEILRGKNVAMLRIRMPIVDVPHPRNYITKILTYALDNKPIIVVPNSMTYLPSLVHVVEWFAETRYPGVFNVVNPGTLSAPDILSLYSQHCKAVAVDDFNYITGDELNALTLARRSNCILSSKRISLLGLHLPFIGKVVEDLMTQWPVDFRTASFNLDAKRECDN